MELSASPCRLVGLVGLVGVAEQLELALVADLEQLGIAVVVYLAELGQLVEQLVWPPVEHIVAAEQVLAE